MSSRRIFRSLVLLMAISATLLVSTVAASPAHFHQNDFGAGCDVCAISHLPVIQPVPVVQVASPGVSVFRIVAAPVSAPAEPFVAAPSSRGPPALPPSFV